MDIEDTIRKAKYNDAVVVTIPSDESTGAPEREIVVAATLDEENGGVTWQSALPSGNRRSREGADGLDLAIVRHLRTKRWVLPMLNDHRRNELYDHAVRMACQAAAARVVHDRRKVLRVLDIGTGTGLLAMMAARHSRNALKDIGATNVEVKVTSIEMASAMARLGRLTVRENGLHDVITIIEGHSADPALVLEDRADICTSELLESGLLGEGMLPAIRDAWDRHLRPDASVVPVGARVYGTALEGRESVACYRGPIVSQKPLNTTDFASNEVLERLLLSHNNDDVLSGKGISKIVPIKAEALLRDINPNMNLPRLIRDEEKKKESKIYRSAKPLHNPVLVLEFDFKERNKLPSSRGSRRRAVVAPTFASDTAVVHGVLFHWELDMWDGLTYTTEAGKGPWQDHWQQCLYVFGEEERKCPLLRKKMNFSLIASHDDESIAFSIDPNTVEAVHQAKRQRAEDDDPIPVRTISGSITPERAMQLNDVERSALLRKAVVSALRRDPDRNILDLSDFSLCSVMAAVNGATRVTSLESSTGGLPMLSARFAQLGNDLPRKNADGKGSADEFQILNAHAESLSLVHLHGNKADLTVGEVHYEVLEGWPLQEALNFYFLRRGLARRGLSEWVGSIPEAAIVRGMAVELDPALASAYGPLRRERGYNAPTIQGFRHGAAERHSRLYHTFDASFPMWQYGHRGLTEPFEIARIPYSSSSPTSSIEVRDVEVPFVAEGGTCHALLHWIEYVIPIEGGHHILSTYSRQYRQGLRMLEHASSVSGGCKFRCRGRFENRHGLPPGEDHDFDLEVVLQERRPGGSNHG